MPATPPIVAVVGATASGKSDLALDLAEALGGEIVNTDAMAVYRGMDVGTAKLPVAERRGIPHHLLDHLDVTEPLTVAQLQRDARAAVADVRGRGAACRCSSAAPPSTPGPCWTGSTSRAPTTRSAPAWRTSSPRSARPTLHRRLAGVDPEAAGRILVDNGRRIVRALEVVEITGRPYSATLPVLEYADPDSVQIGVDIDRPTLDERIERRVGEMFEAGFVAEVERLLAAGLREGRTAATAIGYREVAAYLDGDLTLDEARERTVVATRRFARRQDSWFRKDPRVVWVEVRRPARVSRRPWPPWDHSGWVTIRSSRDTARRTTSCCCPTTTGRSTETSTPDELAARVRALCDRRAGIGGDGVLRVVRAGRWASSVTARPSSGSWTTATRTARSRRCAATASGCSPATSSTRAWSTRPARSTSPPATASRRCSSRATW